MIRSALRTAFRIFRPTFKLVAGVGKLPLFLRYLRDRRKFLKMGGHITEIYPIVADLNDQAGTVTGHYFHQDLLVAQYIFDHKPERHLDVGSRVDGFIAHVASFRKIEVADIRYLPKSIHTNIKYQRIDFSDSDKIFEERYDSVSCLHALEHFGLGRCGDRIDPNGHLLGFHNLVRVLKPSGRLYVSFPIGRTNEVAFNAHRVFHPNEILDWIKNSKDLRLIQFAYVDDDGDLNLGENPKSLAQVPSFGCGIYTFEKIREGDQGESRTQPAYSNQT